jgi:hypothetical protein
MAALPKRNPRKRVTWVVSPLTRLPQMGRALVSVTTSQTRARRMEGR